MSTNYPASLDNSTSLPYPLATSATNSPSLADGQDNQNDAIIAIQNLLGPNVTATTPTAAGNVLQAATATTNSWALLTAANLATVTGTGAFVMATSPTIGSPVLTSPQISNATFTGSTGTFSAGTITSSGLITGNNGLLISTGTASVGGAAVFGSTISSVGQPSFLTAVSAATSGATTAVVALSSTSNFGIYFGKGAPSFYAYSGSLYMRSDGSSTSTRLYVSIAQTTTTVSWTNFTSAA